MALSEINEADIQQICTSLHGSLAMMREDKAVSSLYDYVARLIPRIEQVHTKSQLTKICQSAIAYFGTKPQYRYLKAILQSCLPQNPINPQFDKARFFLSLENSCLPSDKNKTLNVDLTHWLDRTITVNGYSCDANRKKKLDPKKQFWLRSNPRSKKQWQMKEFNRYLTIAGVPAAQHDFINQTISLTGLRSVTTHYSDIIHLMLLIKKPDVELNVCDVDSFNITTRGTETTIECDIRLEFQCVGGAAMSGIMIPTRTVFQDSDASIYPQLTSHEIGHCIQDNNIDVNVGKIVNEIMSDISYERFLSSKNGCIRQSAVEIDCSAYIEQLQHTGNSSILIFQHYCLVALPNTVPEERYYLFDIKDVLGQGNFGKAMQAYRLDENNPIVTASNPEFVAKSVPYTLFSQNEMVLSKPYVSILGSVNLMSNYAPIPETNRVAADVTRVVTIMEKIPGQTLKVEAFESLQLSLTDRLRMVLQLVLQVQTMHETTLSSSTKIIHCDLKMDNVMFYKDSQGKINIRIIDFGLAEQPAQNQSSKHIHRHSIKTFSGNANYAAPENMDHECGFPSDIHMLTPIIAQILGEKDFMKHKDAYKHKMGITHLSFESSKVQKAVAEIRPAFDNILAFSGITSVKFRTDCMKFLRKMSNPVPSARPDITLVVRFFTDLKNSMTQRMN